MEQGFDAAAVSSQASQVSQTYQDLSGPVLLIAAIAVLGFFGRLLFVSFGDRLKGMNPFTGMSGRGLLGSAVAIAVVALVLSGKDRVLLIRAKATLVDPFVVSVLKKDSCDPVAGSYCVVVFEEGREIVVNWYDRRVNMFRVVNRLDMNPVTWSPRPRLRPGGAGVAGQSLG